MPELPEVETVVRQLRRALAGRRIEEVTVRAAALRRELEPERLVAAAVGRRVERVERRAKYIVVELEGGGNLLLHLGMSGSCRIRPRAEPAARHEHVLFRLDDDSSWRFIDPRRFGLVEGFPPGDDRWPAAELEKLGPEPLSEDFSATAMVAAASGRSRPVKEFLMDQEVVAGIGNIYASELLFRARVHPGTAAGRISPARWRRIVAATREVLEEAIAAGGTTVDSFTSVDGSAGLFVVSLRVYGRAGQPCPVCSAPIRQSRHQGRSTYYCPRCQG